MSPVQRVSILGSLLKNKFHSGDGRDQGWQGRAGALTSAPRPAPRSAPAQVTTPGSSGGKARRGAAVLASRAQPSPACSTLRLKMSLKK